MTKLDDLGKRRDELKALSQDASQCERCELFQKGTQTVFGEGDPRAKILLVGEQPGDKEDIDGRPFVGPAGKLLFKALLKAGLSRSDIYVTNAVKHFNWRPAGKRRIHEKPKVSHIKACHIWLEGEVKLVRPKVIVCLGTTAGRAVFGRAVTIKSEGDKVLSSPLCDKTLLTIHPAAIVRLPEKEDREAAFSDMVKIFRRVKALALS